MATTEERPAPADRQDARLTGSVEAERTGGSCWRHPSSASCAGSPPGCPAGSFPIGVLAWLAICAAFVAAMTVMLVVRARSNLRELGRREPAAARR